METYLSTQSTQRYAFVRLRTAQSSTQSTHTPLRGAYMRTAYSYRMRARQSTMVKPAGEATA